MVHWWGRGGEGRGEEGRGGSREHLLESGCCFEEF
jgi:hypothetical protein